MLSVPTGAAPGSGSRTMVQALFVSTVLLSIVSWYTTWQGMALYLNGWFAFLASLGVQSALVLVAWLIGFTRTGRPLLTAVYAITAVVSVAFSYVSLYTWFSARERPALVERRLYDTIHDSAGKTEQLLASAIAEGRKHVVALDEMTAAEKAHGYIARGQDADPYLQRVRAAVAGEVASLGQVYKEGSGAGLRYTAFERHAKVARQVLEQLEAARKSLAEFRAGLKPNEASDEQIRRYRAVYDAVPWTELEEQLHAARVVRPAVPALSEHLDKTASGQEELLLAFTELASAPTGRHVFAFLLAAFIDVIVFLLAYASGPFFAGTPEQRWPAASAALDEADPQVFARDFLRKIHPDAQGEARVPVAALTAGERQYCILLTARKLATLVREEGQDCYLVDSGVHQQLLESLSAGSLPLRGARLAATSQAGGGGPAYRRTGSMGMAEPPSPGGGVPGGGAGAGGLSNTSSQSEMPWMYSRACSPARVSVSPQLRPMTWG